MFSREELLPGFIRFSNVAYRLSQQWTAAESFEASQQNLATFLADLKGRLAWELPLLCAFSVGPQLGHEIGQAFGRLEAALAEATEENVESVYTPALEPLLEKLRLAEALKEELPRITDVKIVNELLLLTSAVEEKRIDNAPIAQRLPLLLDWIARYETGWRTYLRLFPDQLYRVNKVLAAFEAMRAGAGGVFLFLEGEDPNGLKGGLSMVLNALRLIAPSVETRFLTESERVEFSADLRLERAWRGADWHDWSGTSLAADLLLFYQQTQRDIARISQATLMPVALAEQLGEQLPEIESRLIMAFDTLWQRLALSEDEPARPPRAEALAELESCRRELEAWQLHLDEALAPYHELQAAPLYSALVGVLTGVLAETTPDASLHQLTEAVAEGRVRFQETIERAAEAYQLAGDDPVRAEAVAQAANLSSRFDLAPAHGQVDLVFDSAYEVVQVGAEPQVMSEEDFQQPQDDEDGFPERTLGETDAALEAAWDALHGQEQALEALWEYLQTGERPLLYQAFELFSEPFFTLAELAPIAPAAAVSDELIGCPFCQETFSNSLDRCPGCKRLVSLQERQSQVPAQETVRQTGSPLLAALDRDTMGALSGGALPGLLGQRWRDLASKLEAMGRAAKSEGKSAQLETLLSKLVADCHRVAATLAADGQGYLPMRDELFDDFARLEHGAKPTS